jgi:hypothetical protein
MEGDPMGDKARRRREFLARHPLCCFCGGVTSATTIDHVPSRQLFDNKRWPEGYEFPACEHCNGATRNAEQVIAMIARAYPDGATEQQREEMGRILQAIANNYPEVLLEMKPSARKVRSFLKSRGLEKESDAATKDYPLMAVDGPIVGHCVTTFAIKLFCALHYEHLESIVPPQGGVAFRWYSNFQMFDGSVPEEVATMIGGQPTLQRCKTNLDDQFSYRFSAGPDIKASMFWVWFRRSFAIFGCVREDASLFPPIDGLEVFPPRRPHTALGASPGTTP